MSKIKEIKKESEFREINGKPIMLAFSAAWCGPCRMMAPVYAKIAEDNKDVEVIKVDADLEDLKKLVADFGVRSVPSIFFINKDGKTVKSFIGGQSEDTLKSAILEIA